MGITVSANTVTTTFAKGIAGPSTTPFQNATTSYADVTGMSISSVPNGSKIYFSFYVSKDTGGTMDIRITDGTNVFYEQTGITTGVDKPVFSLDGSVTQNSGGAATVKVQIVSSDANNANFRNDTNGLSWFFCTDMTGADPIVYAPHVDATFTQAELTFPARRHISTLYGFKASSETVASTTRFNVSVNGLQIEPIGIAAAVEDAYSADLNVVSGSINVIPQHPTPVWASANNRGRGALILCYTGFSVQITG